MEHTDLIKIDKIKLPTKFNFSLSNIKLNSNFNFNDNIKKEETTVVEYINIIDYERTGISVNRRNKGITKLF